MTAAYAHATVGVASALVPAWLSWPWQWRHRRHLRHLDEQIFKLIHQRQSNPATNGDLLSLLLHQKIGSEMTGVELGKQAAHNQQVRDEIVTMFVAAYETVASCLTWTLWLLMQHADAAQKARAEVDAVLGKRLPTQADLDALPYLTTLLQESLRLYPPGWRISRVAQADDVIDGYHIPAGISLLLIVSVLHRHADFWPDPHDFRPERFASAARQEGHRYTWLPFGNGRRYCIGANFAMQEMQLALASILQLGPLHLDMAKSWRAGGKLRTATTLQPGGPLWVYF